VAEMRALLLHVRPHRSTLILAAVLGLLGAAAGLAQPLAAREVIEALAADESLTRPLVILSVQLDAVNEAALRAAVAGAAVERAVVAIVHRLSTVVAADRILVIEGGRVRAQGTHVELVEEDELYRELAASQLSA
jgi:ABC-type multidrug transport system fused ATPase/permease subunit